MFRIKTALLACLLLVAATSSVSALGQTQAAQLSSFGEFVAHGSHAGDNGASLHRALTALINACIRIVPESRFHVVEGFVGTLENLIKQHTSLLISFADSKSTQIDTDGLLTLLQEAKSALKSRDIKAAMDVFTQVSSMLKELN